MKRFALVVILLVAAITLLPAASVFGGAGDSGISAEWLLECDPVMGGYVLYSYSYFYPDGYRNVETWVGISPTWGDYTDSTEWIVKGDTWIAEYFNLLSVPPDGSHYYTSEVWAPDGTLVTTLYVYASCPSGELRFGGSDIYNVNAPVTRVMGTVNYDTPLYTEANPDTVRSEVLTAGQTWFVVDSATGTDGNLWYEVFVGGWHNAYVPAAALTLDGPLP